MSEVRKVLVKEELREAFAISLAANTNIISGFVETDAEDLIDFADLLAEKLMERMDEQRVDLDDAVRLGLFDAAPPTKAI